MRNNPNLTLFFRRVTHSAEKNLPSTKPHRIGAVGFVEAARFLGGQIFASANGTALC
jgi:hypothetical protein